MFNPFGIFDFDCDGETDFFEHTMGLIIADDILTEEEKRNEDFDDDEFEEDEDEW